MQMFSTRFPSGIGYLLPLKTILIPTKTQNSNTCLKSTKDFQSYKKTEHVTDVVRMSSLLALNTFHALR